MKDDPCRRYHDRVAHSYDDSYKTPYWEFVRAVIWREIRKVLPVSTSTHILDIGGGTGLWAMKLAKSGYKVTLADLSQGMLDAAQVKMASSPHASKITLVRADICDLSAFPDGEFGMALAEGDPISFCSSPQKAVSELFRVLKPGSAVVAGVDNKIASMRMLLENDSVKELFTVAETGRTKWFTKNPAERFDVTCFTPKELRKLFERGGFVVESLVGKTVLPIKRDSPLLEDREMFDRLLELEFSIHSEEAFLGLASHLEITVRKP